jgi:PPOX class probable FMN-dependent enzyme
MAANIREIEMKETASPIGVQELRQHYAEPVELARKKIMPCLDPHATRFIALSPFLTIATMSAAGADCSPRGDAPGFVQVVNNVTLRIPDRRGNNLLDTMQNILAQPDVGLLFFVPGVNETLRINGTASIVTDPELLAPLAIKSLIPASALEVTIRQVYFHCGRALLRADLWNPEKKIGRDDFPRLGTILADQVSGVDGDKANATLDLAYTTNLY